MLRRRPCLSTDCCGLTIHAAGEIGLLQHHLWTTRISCPPVVLCSRSAPTTLPETVTQSSSLATSIGGDTLHRCPGSSLYFLSWYFWLSWSVFSYGTADECGDGRSRLLPFVHATASYAKLSAATISL